MYIDFAYKKIDRMGSFSITLHLFSKVFMFSVEKVSTNFTFEYCLNTMNSLVNSKIQGVYMYK